MNEYSQESGLKRVVVIDPFEGSKEVGYTSFEYETFRDFVKGDHNEEMTLFERTVLWLPYPWATGEEETQEERGTFVAVYSDEEGLQRKLPFTVIVDHRLTIVGRVVIAQASDGSEDEDGSLGDEAVQALMAQDFSMMSPTLGFYPMVELFWRE